MRGKTVAIVGGGPAGSFAGYLLAREGVKVYIFDPQSTRQPDLAAGEKIHPCTGCAGLLHANAVRLVEQTGVNLPESLIQTHLRGAVTYFPDTLESIPIPLVQAVTVYRGFSPIKQEGSPVESFDAYLLNQAKEAGAVHYQAIITKIDLSKEGAQKPVLTDSNGDEYEADIVIGAFGHNPKLMGNIHYPTPETKLPLPKTQRASVREYYFGQEKVRELLKEKIHVFGNPTEKIWFAAIVPKEDYISVVLMGRDEGIKAEDFLEFFQNPHVHSLTQKNLEEHPVSCSCFSQITIKSPERFIVQKDKKVVMINIGDAGPTSPRKNGIHAAMDSAQHLIEALVQNGNEAKGLKGYRKYIERRYVWDNRWSEAVLKISDFVLNKKLPRQAIIYLAKKRIPVISQAVVNTMSHILTGKDAYWEIPLKVVLDTLRNPLK